MNRCTIFSKFYRDQPGKSADVADLTLAEIKQLSLKRAHNVEIDTLRMPTLREALECCKDRICVNVDPRFCTTTEFAFLQDIRRVLTSMCSTVSLQKNKASLGR